tara:strand:- start:2154 stop:2741 length:588 start_codon:yes stop_codon:yes gene_type:complete
LQYQNKDYIMKAILAVSVLALTVGCSSTYNVKKESSEDSILTKIPEWYIVSEEKRGLLDRKNKHQYIYGVGTAVSSNLQLSIEKAMMIAKADLADQIAGRVNKDTIYSVIEAGEESSVEMATETTSTVRNVVDSIAPIGYEEWNKAVSITASNQYRVYVGLKWTRKKKNALNDLISAALIGGVEVVQPIVEVQER